MATKIRSLTPEVLTARKVALHNVLRKRASLSPVGLNGKIEKNRRAVRDINSENSKRPALRALKASVGSLVREIKTPFPSGIFAKMTPAQVRKTLRCPARLHKLLADKAV